MEVQIVRGCGYTGFGHGAGRVADQEAATRFDCLRSEEPFGAGGMVVACDGGVRVYVVMDAIVLSPVQKPEAQ